MNEPLNKSNPSKPGRYLVLCCEWVGLESAKKPARWEIKQWDGKRWERAVYYWDTGWMENLEVVAWLPLPDVPQ